jgi:predicted DNA-binding mobile mystery protein A
MKRILSSVRSRESLRSRFDELGRVKAFAAPARGWIKAIREGLGMSTQQLARRLNISQPSVTALEQSEAKGSIELASLRRVAEALDCKLVYALVPNRPLDAMVRDRARAFLRRRREPIEHSMALEDQKVSVRDLEARLDEIIRETNPRLFWD